MADVEPIAFDLPVLTAHLTVDNALDAIDFYKSAHGADG